MDTKVQNIHVILDGWPIKVLENSLADNNEKGFEKHTFITPNKPTIHINNKQLSDYIIYRKQLLELEDLF